MIYQRYFKNGQKILLTALEKNKDGRKEHLSATINGGDEHGFIVSLPYSEDAAHQYPFNDGQPFEISSDSMGLGVRVTGSFRRKIDGKRISLAVNNDLQMFQRRGSPRMDCKLGIRFTRSQGALQALRKTWEKNIKLLHSPSAPLIFEGFKPCYVNLSTGGIRFNLRPPVNPAELCLLLLNLDDGKPPVCALAEVVWTRPENNETIVVSGMRFINILEEDQNRIATFINSKKQG
ncbi:PilZ domain-containing protein [Malonomonas rubra DSM 5091]|uniref:PilZ domain-containing protein n=1 Tax=Malonomonas rubra DSM 5091 TaxID=1122189 RepID=A0A1M6E9P3_MALRU|nr:PilZ domain-containing protein [Malonomonas rubra]SHI82206.1 PilZ domain-containing protein [Malonomonas rubra DSM 5091]